MNYQFDLRGNLQPPDLIETDYSTFRADFGNSPARVLILDQFQSFLNQLKELLPIPLELWVDGSFITKKENPADIDLVVFIDFQHFIVKQEPVRKLFRSYGDKQEMLVDAYPVVVYPENHSNFMTYRSDYLYWLNLFGQSRPNRAKKQFPKGIIKITF